MKTLLEEAKKTLMKRRENVLKLYRSGPSTRRKTPEQEPDWLDQAANQEDAALHAQLAEGELREIKAIDAALARMQANVWGYCVGCGCPIEGKRLQALPETTRCLGCSEVAAMHPG